MRKGLISSGVFMILVFSVIMFLFAFVLSENELHNSAVTGLAVEQTRWIGDADDYYCKKDVASFSDWATDDYETYRGNPSSPGGDGVHEFRNNFQTIGSYSRGHVGSAGSPENTSNFSSGYIGAGKGGPFDFFVLDDGFKVGFVHNYPPRVTLDPGLSSIAIPANGVVEFEYDVCDAEDEKDDLLFSLEYAPDPPGIWRIIDDSSSPTRPINDVIWSFTNSTQVFSTNLTSTGLSSSQQYCFRLTVEDSGGKMGSHTICGVRT